MRTAFCTACALLLAGSGAAQATELCFDKATLTSVPCEAPNFTGLYLGVHAGVVNGAFSGVHDNGQPATESFSLDDDELGPAFGGQIAALYQFQNNIVIGAELDASFVSLDAESRSTDGLDAGDAEINAIGSLRAKLGFAIDRVLPYVTAGYGLVDFEYDVADPDGATTAGELSDTLEGAVYGGGLEYLIAENATIRVEGLYYDIDERLDASGVVSDANLGDFVEVDEIWTLRLGASVKF